MIRPEAVKLCEGCQRQTQAVVGAEKLPRLRVLSEVMTPKCRAPKALQP